LAQRQEHERAEDAQRVHRCPGPKGHVTFSEGSAPNSSRRHKEQMGEPASLRRIKRLDRTTRNLSAATFAPCQGWRRTDNGRHVYWEKPLGCGAEGATAPETLRQKDQ